MNAAKQKESLRFHLFEIGIHIPEESFNFLYLKVLQQLSHPPHQQLLTSNTYRRQVLEQALVAVCRHYYQGLNDQLSHHFPNALACLSTSQKQLALEQMALPTFSAPYIKRIDQQFSIRDYLQYTNLFDSKVQIVWFAIHQDLLLETSTDFIRQMQLKFPREMALWYEGLFQKKISNTKDYVPLPLHPLDIKQYIQPNFSEAQAEHYLIGPLVKQKTFPLYDHRYLISPDINKATIKIDFNIKKEASIQIELQQTLNYLLNTKIGNTKKIFCLFEDSHIQLKHSEIPLKFSMLPSPTTHLSPGEYWLPLNALLQPNTQCHQTDIFKLIYKNKKEALSFYMHFIKLYIETHTRLLKHNIDLKVEPEHLLLVFNEQNQLSKFIYRDPKIVNLHQQPFFQIKKFCHLLIEAFTFHTHEFDAAQALQTLTDFLKNLSSTKREYSKVMPFRAI
jgi:hypothetical protein